MLKMDKVSYAYKDKSKNQTVIFNDKTLEFELGKFYTIYGVSGSGKTTCLSLLGGLDTPTSGTIFLDQVDIKKIGYNTLRQKYISYIFQDYHLFSYMTAVENITTAIAISHKKVNKKLAKEKANRLLEKVGIEEKDRNRVVCKLSGGQQQRVAIARAIAMDSKYILADEPTGNLDRENTINIINILKNLAKNEGKCVIVVTHSEYVKEQSDICYTMGW